MGRSIGSSRLNALSICFEDFDVAGVCGVRTHAYLQRLIRLANVLNIPLPRKTAFYRLLAGVVLDMRAFSVVRV